MSRTRSVLAALAVALTLPTSGCYVYDEPGIVGADSYSPDYYDGNVVYFDNDEPYYIVGDDVRYVPRDRPEYHRFRSHYLRFQTGYRQWYGHHPPRIPLRGARIQRRDEQREEWHERRDHRDRD